jgi:hypothetical protein
MPMGPACRGVAGPIGVVEDQAAWRRRTMAGAAQRISMRVRPSAVVTCTQRAVTPVWWSVVTFFMATPFVVSFISCSPKTSGPRVQR